MMEIIFTSAKMPRRS